MKSNTETRRHRVLFLEKINFTEKSTGSVNFVISSIFISLCLCVSVFNEDYNSLILALLRLCVS